jgi:hypothetical protein
MARRWVSLAVLLAVAALLAPGLEAGVTAAAAAQTAERTVTITFVGCPPGGDESGPPPGCDDVVEAPVTAMVTASPDVVLSVRDQQRNADGSYTVTYPESDGIGLVGFFPQDFNYFTFDGVDTLGRWYAEVQLADGESSRNVTVSYWNGPNGLIEPAENTLVVNANTCGEGIDPSVDASGCEPTDAEMPGLSIGTTPLRGIAMDDFLSRDGGTLTYAGLPAYTQAQVVAHAPLAGYGETFITGQAEVIEDDAATAFLLRGETRVIDVYFYAPDESTVVAPTPTPEPEPGTGTLRLLLLSCPPGVVPHDDPGRCTEAMAAEGNVVVTFAETGERIGLSRFDRDESGAYVITGIRGSVTISGITPGDRDRIASDADQISGQDVVYDVDAGQTREGRLYFFDNP